MFHAKIYLGSKQVSKDSFAIVYYFLHSILEDSFHYSPQLPIKVQFC